MGGDTIPVGVFGKFEMEELEQMATSVDADIKRILGPYAHATTQVVMGRLVERLTQYVKRCDGAGTVPEPVDKTAALITAIRAEMLKVRSGDALGIMAETRICELLDDAALGQ